MGDEINTEVETQETTSETVTETTEVAEITSNEENQPSDEAV